MLDFIIKNAYVCTGLPEKGKIRDIGVLNSVIIVDKVNGAKARQTIDGTGLILTPGFIDPHASTGFGYFFPNAADHKLYQGITTEIFGNCGTSPAPVGQHLLSTMNRLSEEIGFPFNWQSLTEYFHEIKDHLQFNIATLIGHSTLRAGYLDDWKMLKRDQLTQMKTALAKAMEEGGLGLSTGLIYAPGCFANLDEIVELAKIAAEKGGVYASHIRDERNKLEEAVEEALTISKRAGIRTLISHLKAAERQNWGKIERVLRQIEAFNNENPGMEAAVDVYPYTAVSTKLRAFIPHELLKDGIDKLPGKLEKPEVKARITGWIKKQGYDLSRMMIISDEFEAYSGKTVTRIASEQKLSESDAIAEILIKSTETWMVYHCISQNDIDTAILWDKAMICTDSWSYPINAPKSVGRPHPRSYGAFTAYLERYVMDVKALSWEEAVHKITCLPARFFGLKNRGLIKKGYHADLVLINPDTLKANATYMDPKMVSDGVEYLWVNGELVIDNRAIMAVTPGKVLTLNGSL